MKNRYSSVSASADNSKETGNETGITESYRSVTYAMNHRILGTGLPRKLINMGQELARRDVYSAQVGGELRATPWNRFKAIVLVGLILVTGSLASAESLHQDL